jgi:AraC-like DNA-binding protein
MLKNDHCLKVPYYKVAKGDEESFRLLEICGGYPGCSWHFHPECQLGLVVSGGGERVVGDSIRPIMAGEVILLGANLPHVWRYEPPGSDGPSIHAIVVHFRDDFAGSDFVSKPELRDVRTLLARAKVGLQAGGSTREQAAAMIQSMARHEGLPRLLDLLSVLHLLASSRDLTTLCSAGFHPLCTDREVERMRRVCNHIQEHLNEPLPRDEAAALAFMSPSAFSRFFKAHTGKTFHEFVNEVRIGHACRLLMDAEFNISEVALQCGFNEVTSFNRSFRRLKGTSPTEYRRRLQAVTR